MPFWRGIIRGRIYSLGIKRILTGCKESLICEFWHSFQKILSEDASSARERLEGWFVGTYTAERCNVNMAGPEKICGSTIPLTEISRGFWRWEAGLIPLGFLANPQLSTDLILSLPTTVRVGLVVLFTPVRGVVEDFRLGLEAKLFLYLLTVDWYKVGHTFNLCMKSCRGFWFGLRGQTFLSLLAVLRA
jgi:hypothetical protein